MTVSSREEAKALSDVCAAHAAFRPPHRVSVAEGAAEILHIEQPGGYTGNWSAEETPYMVEPMNMMASRSHDTVCFVGPARTGKTMGLLDGFAAHVIVNDPGDMLIVQMSQEKAREFSKTRIDRAIRNSPALKAMLGASPDDDNTHDKQFTHGMFLRIGWPTVSQMSSSDYRYVVLTDYDRMPDDVGGEGAPYGLALKRTQTFLSRGMCAVESSPGRDIVDPNWKPATRHEAPPTTGVLGIYNRGDRRRWYWRCLDCREWFEASPGLDLFGLPSDDDLIEIVRTADLDELASEHSRIICPHCSHEMGPDKKNLLNRKGRWVGDGQTISGDGELSGDRLNSPIASFWMGGVAAAYQSWKSLIHRHLLALREYALTGAELTLQTTANTDQGVPYMSRLMRAARNSDSPDDRVEPDMQRYIVPDEARFICAAVDVQGGQNPRFEVQVHAIGPNLEQWLIDRYSIKESAREGVGTEFAPIDPARYAEDWDQITERVLRSTYRTGIPGREMMVRMIAVDSGGEDGVTDKAYAWYRRMRVQRLAKRIMLVKGASTKQAPLIKESLVGGRHSKEAGDIPLQMLNVNMLKDAVSTGLKRQFPGPGYIHLPSWPSKAFFDELQSEVRMANGTWKQVRSRNEAFDLSAYIRACCLKLGADKIRNWDNPPAWAAPLDRNSDVVSREERREMQADGVGEVAAAVKEVLEQARRPPAPAARPVQRRRAVSRSSYLA